MGLFIASLGGLQCMLNVCLVHLAFAPAYRSSSPCAFAPTYACCTAVYVSVPTPVLPPEGITKNDIEEARLFDQVPATYSPKWLREHPEASPGAEEATETPSTSPATS